jgi:hypothetical protein
MNNESSTKGLYECAKLKSLRTEQHSYYIFRVKNSVIWQDILSKIFYGSS